jgi:hypothetical protein
VEDREAGMDNQVIDLSVEVAPAAEHVLNRIQSILPSRDLLVVAPAML